MNLIFSKSLQLIIPVMQTIIETIIIRLITLPGFFELLASLKAIIFVGKSTIVQVLRMMKVHISFEAESFCGLIV